MSLAKKITKKGLGSLSEKYETGGRGPGTVSSGVGDAGGRSYGTYQFTTKPSGGSVTKFLQQSKWSALFSSLSAGTPEFTAQWKELSRKSPVGFAAAQHDYIMSKYFSPFAEKVFKQSKIDASRKSRALQQVFWSVAVQHGPNTSLIKNAVGSNAAQIPEKKLINLIYQERSKKKDDGNLAYFSRNSQAVQKNVTKRFQNERSDALALLASESDQHSFFATTDTTSQPAVRSLQKSLTSLGFDVEEDGHFGEMTTEAVKDLQAAEGIPVTGIANKEVRTLAVLRTPLAMAARPTSGTSSKPTSGTKTKPTSAIKSNTKKTLSMARASRLKSSKKGRPISGTGGRPKSGNKERPGSGAGGRPGSGKRRKTVRARSGSKRRATSGSSR